MTVTAGVPRAFRFADLRVWSREPLPDLVPDALAPCGPDADDLAITWGRMPALPPVEWYHRWGNEGEPDWLRFGQAGEDYLLDFPGLVRFLIADKTRALRVEPGPAVPDVTVRHLLLNQVLPLVLSQRGRLVLHAAAIAVGDEVMGLVGPTGSGKSTLVAACGRLGAAVVADDSLVLHRQGQGWVAVPSYPAVRLWPDALDRLAWPDAGDGDVAHYHDKRRLTPKDGVWRFETRVLPLTRLWMLDGPKQPPHPVALELFSQVFRLDVRDHAESARLFHLIADLAASVSVAALDAGVDTRNAADAARRLVAAGPLAGGAFFKA
ncbi:MAG: hypothetical protein NUW22_04690 [Acidobacteria bacterium]|nr:hypothetical protein [Acidobacteriota bacterium]